jgi:hypothetical protein
MTAITAVRTGEFQQAEKETEGTEGDSRTMLTA